MTIMMTLGAVFIISVWMLAGASCGVLLTIDDHPDQKFKKFWIYTLGGIFTVVYLFYRIATDKQTTPGEQNEDDNSY